MSETFIPPKNTDDLTPLLSKAIKDKRVCIFIDAANLYHAAHKAKLRIDYFHLVKWFQSHCKLNGVNFYTAFDPEDKRQNKFFEDLERAGYRVIKKPIRVFTDQRIKGNMDIELAVDIMLQKDMYDILVLFSGDGDFSYLIRALEHMEKETVLLGIGGFTSYELHQEVDHYFFMNRIKSVWLKPGRPRNIPIIIPDALANAKTLAEEKLKRLQPRRPKAIQQDAEKTGQSLTRTNSTETNITHKVLSGAQKQSLHSRIPKSQSKESQDTKESSLLKQRLIPHKPSSQKAKSEIKTRSIPKTSSENTKISPKVRVRVTNKNNTESPNTPQILVD